MGQENVVESANWNRHKASCLVRRKILTDLIDDIKIVCVFGFKFAAGWMLHSHQKPGKFFKTNFFINCKCDLK